MRFRAHDTFFIRKGWLHKGMKNIVMDSTVFMGDNGNPMDILGMGANMVKALRYWLQVVGLTEEPLHGKKYQKLTELGNIIYNKDKYIEEIGTLWILHYMLSTNKEEATAWYYFFNEFNFNEFTRDDFVRLLNTFIILNGSKVAERSLEDDFNCIMNTYVPRMKSNPSKIHPESNIDCPFGELSLIDIVNKKERIYKKAIPKIDTLPPLLVLAVITDQAKGGLEVKISSIMNDFCNAGKVFNLDIITLTNLLNRIEIMGYIKIVRTAGLDYIKILEKDINLLWCVEKYYNTLNN